MHKVDISIKNTRHATFGPGIDRRVFPFKTHYKPHSHFHSGKLIYTVQQNFNDDDVKRIRESCLPFVSELANRLF